MTASRDFMHLGFCREAGDLMFPDEDDELGKARATRVCRGCPVLEECRRLGESQPYGVWAGRFKNDHKLARSSSFDIALAKA